MKNSFKFLIVIFFLTACNNNEETIVEPSLPQEEELLSVPEWKLEGIYSENTLIQGTDIYPISMKFIAPRGPGQLGALLINDEVVGSGSFDAENNQIRFNYTKSGFSDKRCGDELYYSLWYFCNRRTVRIHCKCFPSYFYGEIRIPKGYSVRFTKTGVVPLNLGVVQMY